MRVALVHDYLTQYGGAERVLAAIHDTYPEAPIFTALAEPALLAELSSSWHVIESPLGRVPGARRHHRAVTPLYPVLFRAFRSALRPFDVVISDSSAWSHHVPIAPQAVHVCYCHSPARFLYRDASYLGPAAIPAPLEPLAAAGFAGLRTFDRRAARAVDRYIANSRAVAERIARAYGVTAPVIYPPVDLARFQADATDLAPEPWYLVVSRLVPHKRIDLAVTAFSRSGLPLKIIGDGRAGPALRQAAGSNVEFLGRLDDAGVAEHMRQCQALILPGVEDLGLTAVEAQAAGRPVIAFGAGGALETVLEGETGLFFRESTPESLAATVTTFQRRSWEPARARANAARFSIERFQTELSREIVAAVETKQRALLGAVPR